MDIQNSSKCIQFQFTSNVVARTYIYVSITHTYYPLPCMKISYHVLNINSGLCNASRYYELWSIVSDIIHSQSTLRACMLSCSIASDC